MLISNGALRYIFHAIRYTTVLLYYCKYQAKLSRESENPILLGRVAFFPS
jgi:hypothetical protein